MIANALPRSLTAGSVDNAILRADGTGGTILQNSDIVIDDASTTTQANVAITNQHSAQANSALVLTPKGTGALIAGPKPNGAASGGNARGANAVDLQLSRTLATEVASNQYSVICGGYRNTASGVNSFIGGGFKSLASGSNSVICGGGSAAGGVGNTCSSDYGFVGSGVLNIAANLESAVVGGSDNQASNDFVFIGCGDDNRATGNLSSILGGYSALSDRYSMQSHAAGLFAVRGDAQRARFVLRCKTTTNSAVELFLDGSSTRLTIPSGKVLALTINICGISSTGGAVAHYMRQYALKNVAATTSEVYAPVTIGTDNAAGTSIALSASDASDALIVSVTGTASTIWRWVASVDAVEIAFGN